MKPQEIIKDQIDKYVMLQKIKKDNNGVQNETLQIEITKTAAILETLGVNLEKLAI